MQRPDRLATQIHFRSIRFPVPYQIRRCHSKRHIVPPSGYESGPERGYNASSIQLASHLLSWEAGAAGEETGFLTQLFTRGSSWHGKYYEMSNLPTEPSGADFFAVTVQHTAKLVMASVEEGEIPQTRESTRVYYARLPWLIQKH